MLTVARPWRVIRPEYRLRRSQRASPVYPTAEGVAACRRQLTDQALGCSTPAPLPLCRRGWRREHDDLPEAHRPPPPV